MNCVRLKTCERRSFSALLINQRAIFEQETISAFENEIYYHTLKSQTMWAYDNML